MKKIAFALTLALIVTFTLGASAATWEVPGDFPTIQNAIDSALIIASDKIIVGPGSYAGALVTKSLEIKGEDGATITSGPTHGSGLSQGFRLLAGSDGATISHFTFEVDLAIMNGDAVNDVTVTQNTFKTAVQGVSNWRGSRWEISHNRFEDLRVRNGGGIAILIGDYAGGVVQENVVSHNTIMGTLHVPATDGGGYNGSGIVLFADYRWGRTGSQELSFNRVTKNKVAMIADDPGQVGVDIVACELTDTRDAGADPAVVVNNAVGFNDFRGTTLQLVLTPSSLDTVNNISRNLGENRGHGLHPSLFQP